MSKLVALRQRSIRINNSMNIRFLELSVPTEDIRESLEFYKQLGFAELTVTDARPHQYAVVSDGRVAIGLHAEGFDEPALTFVSPNVDRRAFDLLDDGYELDPCRIGEDAFHEIGLRSPDGHSVRFVEARTYSPLHADLQPQTLLGSIAELSIRCRDFTAAETFWALAGLSADDSVVADDTLIVRSPGIALGLRDTLRSAGPILRYRVTAIEPILERLDRGNISYRSSGEEWRIVAPEGTLLVLIEDETSLVQHL